MKLQLYKLFPSYSIEELKKFLLTTTDPDLKKTIEQEIKDRESGKSVRRPTPQIKGLGLRHSPLRLQLSEKRIEQIVRVEFAKDWDEEDMTVDDAIRWAKQRAQTVERQIEMLLQLCSSGLVVPADLVTIGKAIKKLRQSVK